MKLCPNNEQNNTNDKIIGYYNDNILDYLHRFVDKQGNEDREYRSVNSCEVNSCENWSGKKCLVPEILLKKIEVNFIQNSIKCSIRKECRWFSQEGFEICKICPIIK